LSVVDTLQLAVVGSFLTKLFLHWGFLCVLVAGASLSYLGEPEQAAIRMQQIMRGTKVLWELGFAADIPIPALCAIDLPFHDECRFKDPSVDKAKQRAERFGLVRSVHIVPWSSVRVLVQFGCAFVAGFRN
jgi:hypothetical protein